MDEKQKKYALRMMSYGVYILTSGKDGLLCASTVTWVSQASFSPPMISVCIKKDSLSYSVVKERGLFVLHLLSSGQKDYAAGFFRPTQHTGNKLNGQPFEMTEEELPVLTDPPAYLVCRVVDRFNMGDHPLFLAEVESAVVRYEAEPLELRKAGWSYGG